MGVVGNGPHPSMSSTGFWLRRETPKESGGVCPFPVPGSNLITPSQGHPSTGDEEGGQVSIVSSGTLVQSVPCQDIQPVQPGSSCRQPYVEFTQKPEV